MLYFVNNKLIRVIQKLMFNICLLVAVVIRPYKVPFLVCTNNKLFLR